MQHPDDHLSHPQSFSGDTSGDVFSESELLADSPMTSARILETQSGYMVVIKEDGGRLSLSVKRRVGTPPTSQLLLTSDESKRFSRILNESAHNIGSKGQYYLRGFDPDQGPESSVEDSVEGSNADSTNVAQKTLKNHYRRNNRRHEKTRADIVLDAEANDLLNEISAARKKKRKALFRSAAFMTAIGVIAVAAVALNLNNQAQDETPDKVPAVAVSNPMQTNKVDKFVRNYVANLLDFEPRSYRQSQIHAMASMSAPLMERYWRETSFPLSKKKLKSLTSGQTILIGDVTQNPTSATTTTVHLYAELSSGTEGKPKPLHLKLDLGTNDDGKLIVLDQKDISDKR